MKSEWAVAEMDGVNLEDKRLNERLNRILSDLGDRPTASIPAACGGYNEIAAAYRFFDNDEVSFQRILAPHYARTLERMSHHEVVLVVGDTTELDVTRPSQQMKGVGLLDGSSRHGACLHLLESFTPDGTPLGALWAHNWTRKPEALTEPLSRSEKDRKRKQTPIEEKESFRWIEGLQHSRIAAQAVPHVTCVYVADSESDIYELFAAPRGEKPVHWLIRAAQDRAIQGDSDESEETTEQIREHVLATPVLCTNQITIRDHQPKTACETRPRRQARTARKADVEVRATTVTLRPPWRPDRKLPEVQVNVVLVREGNPPAGETAVEWILITTLPIETIAQVQEIIRYYCVRFLIEVLFRTLKSGCRVEDRRFEEFDRFAACLAVYLIVAWRTLMVCRLGRSCPDLNCEAVFDPSEWQSVWVATQGTSPPAEPPRLEFIVRLIAQLGGYVNRPNRKDPPGPQTIWIGMQRMRDLAWGWNAFGPGANTASNSKRLM